jgi:hypothetical protein
MGKNERYLHRVRSFDWILPTSNRGAAINAKGAPHSQIQFLPVIGNTLPHAEQP